MQYRRVKIPGISYFFTAVAFRRQNHFADDLAVEALSDAISKVQSRRPFQIDAQVILPNHLHALWTLPECDDGYSIRWKLIKEGFTRWHVAHYGEGVRSQSRIDKDEQAVWQRRFWEHAIRNDADFNHHFDCIHFNPVKHGLVAAPKDWPHSTFHEWVAKGRYDTRWGSSRSDEIAEWRNRK
jgi:putative transposase